MTFILAFVHLQCHITTIEGHKILQNGIIDIFNQVSNNKLPELNQKENSMYKQRTEFEYYEKKATMLNKSK